MSESQGTVIVTGGSRGIRATISRLAAVRGYAVAVNYYSDRFSVAPPRSRPTSAKSAAYSVCPKSPTKR